MSHPVQNACARWEELFHDISRTPSAEQQRHLSGCAACHERWNALRHIHTLLRDAPPEPLSADRVSTLRARILSTAVESHESRRKPSRLWKVAAALSFTAAMAAGATLWLMPHRAENPAVQVSVVAHSDATRFAQVGTPADRIVRLFDGSVTVEVQRLTAPQRFRVMTGDAEVEVRGTAFDVTAHGDHLNEVRVLHGRVEVRTPNQGLRVLSAGERWNAVEPPVPTAAPSSAPAPVEAPPTIAAAAPAANTPAAPAVSSRVAPLASSPNDPAEEAFKAGWIALRAGEYGSAINAFDRCTRAPSSRVAEDASFWRLIALSRANRPNAVITDGSAFLRRYPGSSRRGEVHLMIGKLLAKGGGQPTARAHFDAAAADPNPAIRERAEAELRRLEAPQVP
jgi:ferric-dicitrate binding protein FerR (iron transport regulator)